MWGSMVKVAAATAGAACFTHARHLSWFCLYATSAAGQVGLWRISGLEKLVAWLSDGPCRSNQKLRDLRWMSEGDAALLAPSLGAATR